MAFLLYNEMNTAMRPSQLLDQHFGLGLTADDFLAPFTIPMGQQQRYRQLGVPNYYRPWCSYLQDNGSTIKRDQDIFQVNLDVQQFSPDEITVRTVNNSVVIEGNHDEKQDEHGFISRHFVRRFIIPEGHDPTGVASTLSSDGILTITAPKIFSTESRERNIPITYTGPHDNAPQDNAVKEKKPNQNGDGN